MQGDVGGREGEEDGSVREMAQRVKVLQKLQGARRLPRGSAGETQGGIGAGDWGSCLACNRRI